MTRGAVALAPFGMICTVRTVCVILLRESRQRQFDAAAVLPFFVDQASAR